MGRKEPSDPPWSLEVTIFNLELTLETDFLLSIVIQKDLSGLDQFEHDQITSGLNHGWTDEPRTNCD